jgi:hypothetical protein
VENSGDDAEDGVLLVLGDTANFHSNLGVLELLNVVESVNGDSTTVVEVVELFWWLHQEGVLLFGSGTSQKLVEDVETALSLSLVDDS